MVLSDASVIMEVGAFTLRLNRSVVLAKAF